MKRPAPSRRSSLELCTKIVRYAQGVRLELVTVSHGQAIVNANSPIQKIPLASTSEKMHTASTLRIDAVKEQKVSDEVPARPGLIQVKLSPEVKKFIQARAKEQERSQGWMAAKMLEEAVKREQQEAAQ